MHIELSVEKKNGKYTPFTVRNYLFENQLTESQNAVLHRKIEHLIYC